MVHDHDVRLECATTGAEHEAFADEGAIRAEAVVAGAGDVGPDRIGVGKAVETRDIAVGVAAQGHGDAVQPRVDALTTGDAAAQRTLDALVAEVVAAALEHRDLRHRTSRQQGRRQVVADDLLLQLPRGGADHRAPASRQDR